MSFKKILALGSVFVSVAAMAQAQLGTVSNVQGLVTVSDGVTAGTAVNDARITDGMRFVTTSTGTATLRLDNGCVIDLRNGQAVTVDRRMGCAELVAAVVPPIGGAAGAGAAAGGSFGTGLLAVTTLAGAYYGLTKLVPISSISSR